MRKRFDASEKAVLIITALLAFFFLARGRTNSDREESARAERLALEEISDSESDMQTIETLRRSIEEKRKNEVQKVDLYLYFLDKKQDVPLRDSWNKEVEGYRRQAIEMLGGIDIYDPKVVTLMHSLIEEKSSIWERRYVGLKDQDLRGGLLSCDEWLSSGESEYNAVYGIPVTWEILENTFNWKNKRLSDFSFAGVDLSGRSFADWELNHVMFGGSLISYEWGSLQVKGMETVDLSNASINNCTFNQYISFEQFSSTRSYKENRKIKVSLNFWNEKERRFYIPDDWDFTGLDLSQFYFQYLMGTSVSPAVSFSNAFLDSSDLYWIQCAYDGIRALKVDPSYEDDIMRRRGKRLPIDITMVQLRSTKDYENKILNGFIFSSDMRGWDLRDLSLCNCRFRSQSFEGVDITDSFITGSSWGPRQIHSEEIVPLSKEQFYSTLSYKRGKLQRIRFCRGCDLEGWDLSKKDLSHCQFHCNVRNADFTDSIITDASFNSVNDWEGLEQGEGPRPTFRDGRRVRDEKWSALGETGLTLEQIRSTWNYKTGNMQGIVLPPEIQSQLDAEKESASD